MTDGGRELAAKVCLDRAEARLRDVGSTVTRVVRGGGRVVAGTDSPIIPFGAALVAEFESYVWARSSPASCLRHVSSLFVVAAQLERVVRAWKKGSRKDEAVWERERHQSRSLSVFPDVDGMYVVKGRLDPEVGALLMRAVEAASDALYRERRKVPERPRHEAREEAPEEPYEDARHRGRDTDREAARRRADAVGLLAERALAAGFGAAGRERVEERSEVPISGTRAERYQVVLHVDHETLAEVGEPDRSELEDGTRVSAETSRRLSCDASVVHMSRAPDGREPDNRAPNGWEPGYRALDGRAANGRPLNVGRRTRTISPALRRALEARDRGCRFPGCGLRFTEAHHVIHWADGGETSLGNTVLLCRFHHRLVHEEEWRVEWWGTGRRPAFRDPRGSVHLAAPGRPPRLPGRPTAALVRQNRLRGADPDAWTAGARWKREADIPDDVLFRAAEAAL